MTGVADAGRAGEEELTCVACAGRLVEGWQHCAWCGEAVVGGGRPDRQREESRLVTMVISDLKGSTALAEALDPESLRLVLDQYFAELGRVFEAQGGHIEKRIGDAMVTAFGFPVARPDDAVRALRATADGQRVLDELNDRLHAGWGVRLVNRTGVATGHVVYASATGAHRVLAGEAFDVAGGLEPLAPPLGALVAATTAEAVGDAARFGPVSAYTMKSGVTVDACELIEVSRGEVEAADQATTADAAMCAACGSVREPEHSWCPRCGAAFGERQRRAEDRRTPTIVFADLGAHASHAGVTEAQQRTATLRAFDEARVVLERHGGVVENFIGDAVMAIYGLRQRNEDDALRAVRAALEMQERLQALRSTLVDELGVDLSVKIGVNSGSVIAGDPEAGERLVTGDAVNVAARFEQTARPGDVVMGELTRQLAGPTVVLEPLEPLTLKGKAEPVPAYRVVGFDEVGEATARRFELPFIGRDEEIARLRQMWADVIAHRRRARVTIVGEAGSGKSRLLHELLDDVDGRVLRGGCLPYGEGITFWPVAEIVRAAAGITSATEQEQARQAVSAASPDTQVAVRLHSLLGIDERAVPLPELFWAIRRLLDHLAEQRPLVVVVDGMHWAEPTLRDLLDDLHTAGAAVPLLLVTMERPATADAEDAAPAAPDEDSATPAEEPTAGQPADEQPAGSSAATIVLDALDETAATAVLEGALGQQALPVAVRDRIVRASGGVPLFLEQMVTMLIVQRRLVHDGERWVAAGSIDDLAVPPTIEALLAARIDALDDDQRVVVQMGSIAGRAFPQEAVEVLGDIDDASPALQGLSRRQLVERLPAADPAADHRFRNQMIRDVVYDGLLKRNRSTLHRRFADWMLAGPAAQRLIEVEEILGYHLERAFLLGTEVAAVDDELVAVGARASEHLAASGGRAYARGDMPAAANLLHRSARALHGGGRRAAELLVGAGDAFFETGDFKRATALYDEAEAMATEAGAEVTAASARLSRCTLGYLTGDGVDDDAARRTADELLATFERHGDDNGIARCWRLLANVEAMGCRWGAAERAALATMEHARRAGDRVLELRLIPSLAGLAFWGPTPVPEAIARCEDLLRAAEGNSRAVALISQSLGHLVALQGRFEEGRRRCERARDDLLELGWNFDAALVSINLGPIELLAGRPEAAAAVLARDQQILRDMGEANYVSTTASFLAEAMRRMGDLDAAARLVDEAAELAAADDVLTHLGLRSTRARMLLDQDQLGAALAVAQEALQLAMSTDGPREQAKALLDLAEVHARRGEVEVARAFAEDGFARYAAKGDRMNARRAQALLSALTAPAARS